MMEQAEGTYSLSQQVLVTAEVLQLNAAAFIFKGRRFSNQLCRTTAAFQLSGEEAPFEIKLTANR